MLASPVYATSAGGQIVESATSYVEGDVTKVKFEFRVPVHYQWHFPKKFSEEIMVSLQPLRSGSGLNTRIREHVRVPDELTGIIDEMYVDGTENNNIYLVIHAKYPIKPEFRQDRKSKGVILSLSSQQIKKTVEIDCNSNFTGESRK